MSFDALDLIEVNRALLEEAAGGNEPAILITVATWGRGADPNLLARLQPFRVGLGFNGSVVARVPLALACQLLPEPICAKLRALSLEHPIIVCAEVFKDWVVEPWT